MGIENLPVSEVIFRNYGAIGELQGRELIKKICLSCGFIGVNDSRDVIVDVFFVLILAGKKKKWLSSKDIEIEVKDIRKEFNLPLKGIAGSNIRRVLKQLMDYGFIERVSSRYRLRNFLHPSFIFEDIRKMRVDKILDRVSGYFKKI